MAFSINTNMGALNAYNALLKTSKRLINSQLKIATTTKINSVGDDLSGYNVSKSLEQKVFLMKAAQGNISSAKDMLATAEGALNFIKDKITEMGCDVSSQVYQKGEKTGEGNCIENKEE
jgi:flagellin